jgi:hypothetical protein
MPPAGELRLEPAHGRAVYSAVDDETPNKIAKKFGLEVKVVVNSNKVLHAGLTMHSRLQPQTPIVIAINDAVIAASSAASALEAKLVHEVGAEFGDASATSSGAFDVTVVAPKQEEQTAPAGMVCTTALAADSSAISVSSSGTENVSVVTVAAAAPVASQATESVTIGALTTVAVGQVAADAAGAAEKETAFGTGSSIVNIVTASH